MKESIFKTLLYSNKVNNYAKIIILLNRYDYFKDYYIPNKKLQKVLGISERFITKILHDLQKDNIIYLFYRNNKRYFKFINKKENKKPNIYSYNWLEEED